MRKVRAVLGVVAAGTLLSVAVSSGVVDAAVESALTVVVKNSKEDPVPVKVTNTKEEAVPTQVQNGTANPVKTQAVGETRVTGTVGIANTPNVNVANFPTFTPPPLWQGTPFITNQVVLDAEFEKCEAFEAVPAGMILFAERAIVSLNTRQGGRGGARIEVKPLGAAFPDRIPVPTHPSSPQAAVDGNLDGYEGSIELNLPITEASACFRGTAANGDMTLIGFLVPG